MKCFTTRNVFLVMGYIVVCFPAMLWDFLHYRKSKECWFKGKSSLFMLLLNCQKKEKSDSKIKTDASQVMKMCLCKRQMVKQEKQLHIMFGPLKLVWKCFEDKQLLESMWKLWQKIPVQSVKILKDLARTAYIECNEVANRILKWCKQSNVWLTVTHIPRKLNSEADECLESSMVELNGSWTQSSFRY